MTDPQGQTVDLKNVVFVMTSNLGSGAVAPRGLGFGADADESQAAAEDEMRRMRAVHTNFRPEFINRLDKIVTFRPLARDAMRRIARRELGRALEREGVRRRSILLDFGEDVLDLLLEAGFSEEFGARPLQRAIKEQVLVPLARRIAADPSATHQLLEVRVEDGRLVIDTIALQPATPPQVEASVALPEVSAESAPPRPAFAQLAKEVAVLQARVGELAASGQFATVEARAGELLRELARPSFWDDHGRARIVNSAIYQLTRVTERLTDLRRRVDALAEVPAILRRHAGTAELVELDRLDRRLRRLQDEFGLARLELLAAAASDPRELAAIGAVSCCLSIASVLAPGAREASDWPRTLAQMYVAWAKRRDYDVAQVEADGGYSVCIQGPSVGEILRGEVGIHKRQTPSEGRRRPAVKLARVSLQNGAATLEDAHAVVRVYHLAARPTCVTNAPATVQASRARSSPARLMASAWPTWSGLHSHAPTPAVEIGQRRS